MAILSMRRVSICGLKEDRKAILEKLQAMGVLQISSFETEEDEALQKMDTQGVKASFDRNVQQIEQALKTLDEYAPQKSSMLASFEGREAISKGAYAKVIKDRDKAVETANRIARKARSIAENKAQITKLTQEAEALAPWLSLDIPLNYRGTERTAALIGTLPPGTTKEAVLSLLKEKLPEVDCLDLEVVSSDDNAVYVAGLVMKEDAKAVEDVLRSAGFARPSSPTGRVPKVREEKLRHQIAELTKQNETAAKEIAVFAKERENLRRASDYYRNRSEKYAVLGQIPQSESAFFVEGYAPAEAVPALEKGIGEAFPCILETAPLPEDDPGPTLLRNNHVSETVEGVLKSYGLPTRGHVDPTTVMSFFYIIFFGMMLSDAGYGIIMAVACGVILLKYKHMDKGLAKTMRMFFYCGLSTTFWGFMYGSFFGDAIDVVAKTFFGYSGEPILKPLWFEPLKNPMRLLVWCMLFGVIHLFAGLAIKGIEYLKQKDIVGFVCDVVAWYLLLLGLIFMLLPSDIFGSIAGQSFVFPPAVNTAAKVCAIVGAAVVCLMSGRSSKNWGVRIALGAYDLYGVSGWLSDVLSYSRLLALGLATGVIASVINMMASMFGGGVKGAILFIIVFLVGHTLNIGINALGAYVHTNRLQFVEFFGKFYDGGGKEFKPFKTANKYTEIKEEN